jgi:hypothetical protein
MKLITILLLTICFFLISCNSESNSSYTITEFPVRYMGHYYYKNGYGVDFLCIKGKTLVISGKGATEMSISCDN